MNRRDNLISITLILGLIGGAAFLVLARELENSGLLTASENVVARASGFFMLAVIGLLGLVSITAWLVTHNSKNSQKKLLDE